MTTEPNTGGSNQNPADGGTNTNATQQQGGQASVPNPSDSQGQGGAAATQEQQTPTGAPEAYQAFKVPDGFTLDGDRLSAANEFFKASNFTQDQAQAAVDLFTKLASEDASALQTAIEAGRQQQSEQWAQEAKTQFGDKYDETVGLARTAVKAANDPALTEAFETLGWGNHPALIRAFATFGRIVRDSPMEGMGGSTASQSERSLAERMYPEMK